MKIINARFVKKNTTETVGMGYTKGTGADRAERMKVRSAACRGCSSHAEEYRGGALRAEYRGGALARQQ